MKIYFLICVAGLNLFGLSLFHTFPESSKNIFESFKLQNSLEKQIAFLLKIHNF